MAEKEKKAASQEKEQASAEHQQAAKDKSKKADTEQKKSAESHPHHGEHCKELKKQLDSAQEQLKKAKSDLSKQNDQYLRAEAEIQNMTKHFNKERSDLLKYDGQKMAKAILPAVDDLERALAIKVNDDAGKQLLKGVQMTHDRLLNALKENGVTQIKAQDQPFDPTKHQAVSTVSADGDHKADTVVKVLQTGYQLHDRVLRPAMVVVAQ